MQGTWYLIVAVLRDSSLYIVFVCMLMSWFAFVRPK